MVSGRAWLGLPGGVSGCECSGVVRLGVGSAVSGGYTRWRSGEPDNTDDKDCGFLYKSTREWGAFHCAGYGAHTVCEWRGHQGAAMDRGLWFTPADQNGRPRLSYRASGTTEVASGPDPFPVGSETHVALVLDPAAGSVGLYIDGKIVASAASTAALSDLRDADNWLGRSQVSGDPALGAAISELRIYDRALSAEELAASQLAGPDPAFLE